MMRCARSALPVLAIAALVAATPAIAAPAPAAPLGATPTRHSCRPLLASTGLVAKPREERSEPRPQLLLAVDHRIERCRVLMRANERRSHLPEPEPAPGTARFIPATGG